MNSMVLIVATELGKYKCVVGIYEPVDAQVKLTTLREDRARTKCFGPV